MINQPTPVARVVHVLTDETWNKAKRNTAARYIAAMREPDTDEAIIQRTHPILQQGVVGRYDRNRAELLRVIAESGQGSFLAVLKRCGNIASPGLMSFPLPGTSLENSDEIGRRVQQVLFAQPEVVATARRTGRAELDELYLALED